MNATIADETHIVGEAAYRVLLSIDVKATFIGSLSELPLVLETSGTPDLMILNVTNDLTGWDVVARLQRAKYRGRVLAFVDSMTDPRVRSLAKLSNVQCVARPGSRTLLEDIVKKAVRDTTSSRPGSVSPSSLASYHGIVGQSSAMREIFARVDKVATGDVNVCIHGESGTGKELIARAIHEASHRRARPLVTLDCTTVPEGLMESHLFGHVKGAFTGATEHREGVFSLADTGTLFIDELGEPSPCLQAKLLRVIQTREFTKVGGVEPVRTDIRLITATNKNLQTAVAHGTFREDLYYRVAVLMIKVPPLRERPEDIPLLAEHFLKKFAAVYSKPVMKIAASTLERMITAPWPGNIRQLENFIEQAVILADDDTLTDRDLFAGHSVSVTGVVPAASGIFEAGLPLYEVTRRHILRTLQKARGNRTETARLLRISVRSLHYKLKTYGLTASPDPRAMEPDA